MRRHPLNFVSQPKGALHTGTYGPWLGLTSTRYLGLKFVIAGQTHYGWARLRGMTLTGYAYESVPDKPIVAGVIPRGVENEIGERQTSDPDSGTLGILALGSLGLPTRK